MSNEFTYTTFTSKRIDEQFDQIELLSADLSTDELMLKFHEILVNRVMPVMTYSKNSPELTLYRVTDCYPGFNSKNKACFSFNPKPSEKGRAHIVGFPVFYGSFDPYSAIAEMKGGIKDNEVFYISKWKIKFKKPTQVHTLYKTVAKSAI